MKYLLFLLLFCSVVSCVSYAQVPSDLSKLIPDGDISAAFGEQETTWTIRSSSADFDLHDEINQKVVSRTVAGNETVIVLRTGSFSSSVALSLQDRKSFLSATRFVHPENAQILAISQKLFPSIDPVETVNRYVYQYISNKSLGMPLASDTQVLDLKTGDCKEHAVLAVSILRSAGIPARAVTGLVLLPSFRGAKNVFGFHMWAEAYIGGRWVIIDATYSGAGKYNRYIALARHSLRTEAPLDYIAAVSAVHNLSIRLTDK